MKMEVFNGKVSNREVVVMLEGEVIGKQEEGGHGRGTEWGHRRDTRQIKHGRGIGRCGCGIHSHGTNTYLMPWKAVP